MSKHVVALVCLLAVAGYVWAAPEGSATTKPVAAEPAPAASPAPATTPIVEPAQPPKAAATEPAPSPTPAASAPASKPATKPAPKPAAIKLDVFAHGRTIPAVMDQDLVLELKGTTDTPWEVIKVEGASVQQMGKVEFKPTKEGEKAGTYTVHFKASREGQTTITLSSLIEAGKKPTKEMKFTVTVAAPATAPAQ